MQTQKQIESNCELRKKESCLIRFDRVSSQLLLSFLVLLCCCLQTQFACCEFSEACCEQAMRDALQLAALQVAEVWTFATLQACVLQSMIWMRRDEKNRFESLNEKQLFAFVIRLLSLLLLVVGLSSERRVEFCRFDAAASSESEAKCKHLRM